mgnify:CR=1 FL=1
MRLKEVYMFKLDSEFGVYEVGPMRVLGFDVYVILLDSKVLATFHTEEAAFRRFYWIIEDRAKKYDEPKYMIDYKEL